MTALSIAQTHNPIRYLPKYSVQNGNKTSLSAESVILNQISTLITIISSTLSLCRQPSSWVSLQGTCVSHWLLGVSGLVRHVWNADTLQLMKCITQGTLISHGGYTNQFEGIGKVFTGSCDLLFILRFKVDLVLNGMAGAPFRWRAFVTIIRPKLKIILGSLVFLFALTSLNTKC